MLFGSRQPLAVHELPASLLLCCRPVPAAAMLSAAAGSCAASLWVRAQRSAGRAVRRALTLLLRQR
jgi:hypothetical protein